MKTLTFLTILGLALSVGAQNKSSASAQRAGTAPRPETENVYYYQSWEDGEIKGCLTYSGGPQLLACDNDNVNWQESFFSLVAKNSPSSKPDKQGFHRAFVYAMTHSKKFLVHFSEDAWPKPQEGIKMTFWNCTKEKTITCERSGLGK